MRRSGDISMIRSEPDARLNKILTILKIDILQVSYSFI